MRSVSTGKKIPFYRIEYSFLINYVLVTFNSTCLTQLYVTLVSLLTELNTAKIGKNGYTKMLPFYGTKNASLSTEQRSRALGVNYSASVNYLTWCSFVLGFQGRNVLSLVRNIRCEQNSYRIQ